MELLGLPFQKSVALVTLSRQIAVRVRHTTMKASDPVDSLWFFAAGGTKRGC